MRAPVLFSLVAVLCAPVAFAAGFEVRVTTGDSSAPAAIVSANVADDFPEVGILKSSKGEIPFQKSGEQMLTFVLSALRSNETESFSVEPRQSTQNARAEKNDGHVALTIEGKRVLTYQGTETEFPRPDIKPIYKRGGYIHPVFSPTGKVLTDDYPPNHLHHHGIWFPWTKTVFEGREPDFWNMGEGKGRVEFVKFGQVWSGPVHAGFTAEHRFVDLTSGAPKTALNESWQVTAYAIPGADYFVFDLVSTQSCATASALNLLKYYYGGLGFRGNWAWNGEDKCFFFTSNGETDRLKGNETRGNWCHIGGEVDGGFTGIAVLCHPDNFRAPQPMRLHPREPFFCFAPSQLGDCAIEPGKPYVSRYRFVVKDGRPDKPQLDALWQSYAHTPEVKVLRKE